MFFHHQVRSSNISVLALNAVMNHRIILLAQVENMLAPSSYTLARPLRAVIYGIMLSVDSNISYSMSNPPKRLKYVEEYDRNKKSQVVYRVEPQLTLSDNTALPHLKDIPLLTDTERCRIFNVVMEMETRELERSLHGISFVISVLLYWVKHADPKVNNIHIYTLWLCLLKQVVIDDVSNSINKDTPMSHTVSINEDDAVNKEDQISPDVYEKPTVSVVHSLSDLKRSVSHQSCKMAADRLHCFSKQNSINSNKKGKIPPNSLHLHAFAQLQSVFHAALDLHAILLLNVNDVQSASQFIHGTLFYNLSCELDRRSDPVSYIRELLGSHTLLALWFEESLQHVLALLPSESFLLTEKGLNKKQKRSQRKATNPTSDVECVDCESVDTENLITTNLNNRFCALSCSD